MEDGIPVPILLPKHIGARDLLSLMLMIPAQLSYNLKIVLPCAYFSHTRKMIDSAFKWAASHGLTRINPIHSEEEARLVLSETFELCDETGQTMEFSGTMEVEDY